MGIALIYFRSFPDMQGGGLREIFQGAREIFSTRSSLKFFRKIRLKNFVPGTIGKFPA
jgi:hypothetical protein